MFIADKVRANQVLAQESMVTDWSCLAIPCELLPAAAGGEARVSEEGDEVEVGRSFGAGRCGTTSSEPRSCTA